MIAPPIPMCSLITSEELKQAHLTEDGLTNWSWLNAHCVGSYYSNWIHFLGMFSQVPSIDSTCFRMRRVYRGSICFSLVMILRIPAYLAIKGANFFSDEFFFLLVLLTNCCTAICITCPILRKIVRFLHKIECNKFVFNKFVSNLVQIDLIQFKYSNCIGSICTKTNTNLLHTNLLHSILRKIGHVIQIVVHRFVHKTSAEKNSQVWKKMALLYPQVHRNT